jgi:hypothetical protein
MTDNDKAPDIYAAAIEQLRAAEGQPLDAKSVADRKQQAAAEQLRVLACNYSADQIAQHLIEDERRAVIDEAKQQAARELGVEPRELRVAVFTDEPPVSYAPPDPYAEGLKALRAKESR